MNVTEQNAVISREKIVSFCVYVDGKHLKSWNKYLELLWSMTNHCIPFHSFVQEITFLSLKIGIMHDDSPHRQNPSVVTQL